MGNDTSKLKGLVIDKNTVEANDFWTLYNAEVPNDDSLRMLSIFQGEPVVNGQVWVSQGPMERAVKVRNCKFAHNGGFNLVFPRRI